MASLYSTKVTASGGRHGSIRSEDGLLDLKLALPRALGGRGDATNPEQLFAGGYAALCLSEIKSGYIRDAIRRGLDGKEYALPSLRCAIGAHPCPRPSACASHYSSERKISEAGADVPRLRQ
jgi:hypothetical protein